MTDAPKRPDRRVIKTKKAIRNAFTQLISQRSINSITIKDIADTADINRKTFYNYYAGVYEIVEEIEDELINAFVGALNDMDFADALKNPYSIFTRLTACFSRDLDFYSHLFLNGNENGLLSKITSVLKTKIKESVAGQIDVDPIKLDLVADYSMTGAVAAFQSWFASDRSVSLEEFSNWVSVLITRGAWGIMYPPSPAADGEAV